MGVVGGVIKVFQLEKSTLKNSDNKDQRLFLDRTALALSNKILPVEY